MASIPAPSRRRRASRSGYLPQEGLSLSGRTVFAECMTVFADLRALEEEQEAADAPHGGTRPRQRRIRAGGRALPPGARTNSARATATRSKRKWARCSPAWAFRSATGSGAPKSSPAAGRCASRSPSCCSKSPTCCCSTSPPTISTWKRATGWKSYLGVYPNAFVLVSHDRYFLDVTVRKIAELWNKRVHFYTGGYSQYEAQKTERRAQLQAAYENQQERIQQLEAFINRFRSQATKAKQVQSRIKELEKIERIEIPPEEKTIHFTLPAAQAERPHRGRVQERLQELRRSRRSSAARISSSSAATGWRWWASTARASRR